MTGQRSTYQELLDEQMGAPPPTRVDLDAVINRARRTGRLRRRLGSGLAAGAVLTSAAVASLLVGGGAGHQPSGPTGQRTPSAAVTESAPAPVPSCSPEVPGGNPCAQQRAEELETAVHRRIRELRPGTSVSRGAVGYGGSGTSTVQLDVHVAVGDRRSGKRGYVAVQVTSARSAAVPLPTDCQQARTYHDPRNPVTDYRRGIVSCRDLTAPDGSRVVQVTRTDTATDLHGPIGRVTEYDVWVTKPDQSLVGVITRNVYEPLRDERGGASRRPSGNPPFTLDQMARLALDPNITWPEDLE